MARYREAVCRLCRREGIKLFLKGERCFSEKCAIERRNFAPGQHGKERRPKLVGYGLQLREKQKTKRVYGIVETQFRNYFEKAERQRGVTGENLLVKLERRLDNVVYRMGFATSRAGARQLLRHGHVLVNGRKVNIPSHEVAVGDAITVKDQMKQNALLQQSLEFAAHQGKVSWIEVDRDNMVGKVISLPRREEIATPPIQERLIVELYSK